MNLEFTLPISMLITSEVIDLIRINNLLEKRNLIIDVSNKSKDELRTYDRSTLKAYIKIIFGVYFYYAVMLVGLFTKLIWFSVAMFLITLISSRFASKYEKDPKKFRNYFIVDKSVSIALLIGSLIYAHLH
jgi:hypothetical protein